MSESIDQPSDKTVLRMPRVVTAQAGDSLASLAKKFYDNEQLAPDLARVNGMAISAILTAGTKIRIPQRSALNRAIAHKEPRAAGQALGALPSDIPFQSVTAADGVQEITAYGQRQWWMDQKIWLAAGAGFAVAWLLLSKNSPLKL